MGWLSFLGMARHEFRVPVILAGFSAAILVGAVELFDDPGAAIALPGLLFLGGTFWGWTRAVGKLRALSDIPLSKIATAAQGYARIEGRAAAFPGHPVFSPQGGRPCCWYRYEMEELDEEKRGAIRREEETSEWSFMLEDGSGECVVDPAGARVVPVRVEKWTDDRFRFTEHLILPGDRLVVLAEFSTSSDAVLERDFERRTGEVVAAWKKDMASLRDRFDFSGDGEFSEAEWLQVRQAARREVEKQIAETPPRAQDQLSKPRDRQPFLISAQAGEHLERDLRIWAGIHLALFLGGADCLAWWLL